MLVHERCEGIVQSTHTEARALGPWTACTLGNGGEGMRVHEHPAQLVGVSKKNPPKKKKKNGVDMAALGFVPRELKPCLQELHALVVSLSC